MRYKVIVFLRNSASGVEADFFHTNSLRTLHVLEKKLSKDSKYESWSIIDCMYPDNSNNL